MLSLEHIVIFGIVFIFEFVFIFEVTLNFEVVLFLKSSSKNLQFSHDSQL